MYILECSTVEPVLKDHLIGHKKVVFLREVVFGDRFTYIEMWDFLTALCGLSRQVISHGSGLSR